MKQLRGWSGEGQELSLGLSQARNKPDYAYTSGREECRQIREVKRNQDIVNDAADEKSA